jgi:phosphoglycolate phosphatase-like HAD superfamily hydrolase
MQAAQAAGIRAIGAAYGEGSAELLRATGAFAVIESPLELLRVVDAEIGVLR